MPDFRALIRFNETGEVRAVDARVSERELAIFMWEDGNYSCDCNRQIFFDRAVGVEQDDNPCGDERFSVNLEDVATGEIFYREFDA